MSSKVKIIDLKATKKAIEAAKAAADKAKAAEEAAKKSAEKSKTDEEKEAAKKALVEATRKKITTLKKQNEELLKFVEEIQELKGDPNGKYQKGPPPAGYPGSLDLYRQEIDEILENAQKKIIENVEFITKAQKEIGEDTSTAETPSSNTKPAVIDKDAQTQRVVPSLNDQCLLLEKAADILKKLQGKNPIPGKSPVRQIGIGRLAKYNTNLEYNNAITQMKSPRAFFEILPNQTAQLAHYAAIKVGLRKKGARRGSQKAIFTESSHKEVGKEAVFRRSGQRLGAGIKSINVTLTGIDELTKKNVLVDAEFLFQDMRSMLKDPYKELFKLQTKEGKLYRTIDFELGWNSNPVNARKLNLSSLKMKLKTNLVKYTFDLRQDGSIVVNAQYRGNMVDVFNGPGSNILSLAKADAEAIKASSQAINTKAEETALKSQRAMKNNALRKLALTIVKNTLNEKSNNKKTRQTYGGDLSTDALYKQQNLEKSLNAFKQATEQHVNALVEDTSLGQDAAGLAEVRKIINSQINNLRTQLTIDPKTSTDAQKQQKEKIKQGIDKLIVIDKNIKNLEEGEETAAARVDSAADIAKQQMLKEAALVKFLALQTIGKKLNEGNRINYAYVTKDEIMEFKLAVGLKSNNGVAAAVKRINGQGMLDQKTLTDEQLDTEAYQTIPFVFLGQLVDQILALPTDRKPGGALTGRVYDLMLESAGTNFTVDFGRITYKKPYSGELISDFPLYYLPISLIKVNNFFSQEIVAKEKQFFSFQDFLLGLLRKYLTNIYGVCAREAALADYTAPKVQITVGEKGKQIQYFVYGFKNVISDIKKNRIKFGNYNANLRNKIYHFFFGGQAKGAVQNVKLTDIADETSKTDIYMINRNASERADSKGNLSSHGDLLPVVFQAEIQTLGFPLLNIGQLIYVDLRPYITKENNRQFQANGYYSIHKVIHSFTPQKYTTTAHAIIQYSKADQKTQRAKKINTGKPVKSVVEEINKKFSQTEQSKKIAKDTAKIKEEIAKYNNLIDKRHEKGKLRKLLPGEINVGKPPKVVTDADTAKKWAGFQEQMEAKRAEDKKAAEKKYKEWAKTKAGIEGWSKKTQKQKDCDFVEDHPDYAKALFGMIKVHDKCK